jgi:hypothetical protein
MTSVEACPRGSFSGEEPDTQYLHSVPGAARHTRLAWVRVARLLGGSRPTALAGDAAQSRRFATLGQQSCAFV